LPNLAVVDQGGGAAPAPARPTGVRRGRRSLRPCRSGGPPYERPLHAPQQDRQTDTTAKPSQSLAGYAGGVAGHPDFNVLLVRLLDHRKLNIADLSQAAGVPGPELQAVIDGAVPSPSLLRWLAPALDLHAADLFVIAGVAVPDELAPLDPEAGPHVPGLAQHALHLPPEHRHRLRRLIHSLPQEERTRPLPAPRAYEQYPSGPGGLLVGMLHNRNLRWTAAAKTLLCLTGIYLAASTIGAIGRGRKELSPELLTGLATVLGIPTDDLTALTGIDLPENTPPQNPAAAEIAELIWDVRRLTADQLRHIRDQAESMQQR
jgi:hypothetical protein